MQSKPPQPTKEWVEKTKKRIVAALGTGGLSGWQEDFLADILHQLQKHGDQKPLSDRQQWRLIEALEAAGV
jgi:hypothetical protein